MKEHTTIDATKYTRHEGPGKFEGESPATEHFWEQCLEDGGGETLWINPMSVEGEDYSDEDSPDAEIFYVNAEEAEAFDLPIGHVFMIREDSQGFVYGTCHPDREEAEAKFRQWLGL